jgi:hypothetical protein
MTGVSIDRARAAKEKAKAAFAPMATVVGIGIARFEDGYCLKVNLRQAPAEDVILPDTIDGVPVRLEIVGPIHKR